MKKIIITILIAIIVGIGLGIYSYQKFYEEDAIPTNKSFKEVYAIQVGVFDSIDNANIMARKYNGIVVLDNQKYRVYIAIISNSLNIIKNYYDEKGISYYVRNIEVNDNFYNTLSDYETLLQAASKESFDDIIKNILREYENLNL